MKFDKISELESNIRRGSVRKSELSESLSHRPSAKLMEIDWSLRKRVYLLLLFCCIFMNYDTGVVPVALDKIEKELNFNYSQLAAMAYTPWIIFVSRFFMGFTQAFFVVYIPVWVNNFSPIEYNATWMGVLQGFSPLGIIIGYVITGILINNFDQYWMWRFSIIFQALCEVFLIVKILCYHNSESIKFAKKKDEEEKLDNTEERAGEEILALADVKNFVNQFKALVKNPIFVYTSSSICVTFFMAFAIQFWGTAYIIAIMRTSHTTAHFLFITICITAPILGVFLGGFITDYLGGYKGDKMLTAIKTCTLLTILAASFAIPTGFIFNLYFYVIFLWFSIFFGATLMPSGVGIVVSCVEKEHQAASSSLSQILYNTFGYFFSPIFGGLIMDMFDDKRIGMIWGITTFMYVFGILFLFLSWRTFSKIKKKENIEKLNEKNRKISY